MVGKRWWAGNAVVGKGSRGAPNLIMMVMTMVFVAIGGIYVQDY